MATKIYCTAMDCKFRLEGGRCSAKTIFISDHDILGERLWRCNKWQESKETKTIRGKLKSLMEKKKNA